MFEKEAEEYRAKRKDCQYFSESYKNRIEKAFKDGAEFGYNLAKEEMDYLNKHWGSEEERKANEWHYVKDGNLPKNNTQVLVLLENKRMKVSIFMENKFTVWNKDYNAYTKLYNVIAWKEIVLPELEG